jgi:chitodextrinase
MGYVASLRLTIVATALVGAALFAGTASERASALGPLAAALHCEEGQAGIHASVGEGQGSVDPTAACLSEPGVVQFDATPAPGWTFRGWRGDCADTGGTRCWVRAEPPSEYSVQAFFDRRTPDTPPTAPGNLRVVDTAQTQIAIAWDASSDDGAVAGYEVFLNGDHVATHDATGYNFGGLTCATSYKLSVRARDDTGNVSAIESVEGSTNACPGDGEPPSAPSGLTVSSTQATSVAISWSASTDNVGVTGYDVLVGGSPVGTVTGTAHTFEGLSCGMQYALGVRARDAAGNVSAITAIQASTAACPPGADRTAPSVPTGLAVTSTTSTAIGLSWNASTDNVGVTGYDVLVNGAQRATATGTSATLADLACGTSYTLAVRARDAAGNVSAAMSVGASTSACTDGTDPSNPSDPDPLPAEQPTIGDAATPPGRDELPVATEDLLVAVAGNGLGSVIVQNGARALSAAGADAPIACGAAGFRCFARVPSGTTITLAAKPASGSRLVRWRGACTGSAPICRVSVSATKVVQALFAPQNARSIVAVSLARARARVQWSRSVGRASIVVRGRVARPAILRLQIRRPGGGPLLTQVTPVLAGRFRLVPKLALGLLPRGASVFPGGFVVSLRGRSGRLQVPLQIQTVVLPAPAEGVVRRAYPSATEDGPAALRLPAGTTEAWAHFRFEAQPRAGRELRVVWYQPDGRLLGAVEKANRPEVVSFLRGDAGIPSGLWRAELRAGGRIVKVLAVRIG